MDESQDQKSVAGCPAVLAEQPGRELRGSQDAVYPRPVSESLPDFLSLPSDPSVGR